MFDFGGARVAKAEAMCLQAVHNAAAGAVESVNASIEAQRDFRLADSALRAAMTGAAGQP